jgi:hypothetical protein
VNGAKIETWEQFYQARDTPYIYRDLLCSPKTAARTWGQFVIVFEKLCVPGSRIANVKPVMAGIAPTRTGQSLPQHKGKTLRITYLGKRPDQLRST